MLQPPGSKPYVLFAGNSLLDAAVQFPRLQEATTAEMAARRFCVEQTGYFDWLFGLRRLLSEGARPKTVVLMLTETQLMGNGIRGDYFALRLMSLPDMGEVAGVLHLHPTQAASMFLANRSVFYGLRSEIRKVLLGRLMPNLPQLTAVLVSGRPEIISDDRFYAEAPGRLRALKATCERYGAQLVMLVPALPDKTESRLPKVGRTLGIPVLRPYCTGQFGPRDFIDGFHMNQADSVVYTTQLIAAMHSFARAQSLAGAQRYQSVSLPLGRSCSLTPDINAH